MICQNLLSNNATICDITESRNGEEEQKNLKI